MCSCIFLNIFKHKIFKINIIQKNEKYKYKKQY